MKVVIQKPDLDTCLTALILGVSSADEWIVAPDQADAGDLMDSAVLCIEAGGSGLVHLNDFDHHDPHRPGPPACRQAFDYKKCSDRRLERLVDYVCEVDEGRRHQSPIVYPSLSTVFSGMLIAETDPVRRFFAGMSLLDTVLNLEIDPFGTMPRLSAWQGYIAAKQDNRRLLDRDLRAAASLKTKAGREIGFMETAAAGALGALKARGCGIAVACGLMSKGTEGRKFTIAGDAPVTAALRAAFEAAEAGWGGRGEILSSPRCGTRLSPAQVLQIIIDCA
jgi:hypothetical protein